MRDLMTVVERQGSGASRAASTLTNSWTTLTLLTPSLRQQCLAYYRHARSQSFSIWLMRLLVLRAQKARLAEAEQHFGVRRSK